MRVRSFGNLWAWLGVYVIIAMRCEGFLGWPCGASVVRKHLSICGYAGDSLPVREFDSGNNWVRVMIRKKKICDSA